MQGETHAGQNFYVRERGRVTGPFTLGELQSMVRLRQLMRFHDLSQDGRNWSPAGNLKQIFPPDAISAENRSHAVDIPSEPEPVVIEVVPPVSIVTPPAAGLGGQAVLPAEASGPAVSAPANSAGLMGPSRSGPIQTVSIAQGICAGVILLLCASIPQGKAEGHLLWWWDLFKQSGAGMWIANSLFALTAGLALMFVSTLLRGLPRGWSFIPLGGVGLVLLFIAVALGSVPLALTVLPPAFTAILLGAVFLKRSAGTKHDSGVLLLILGVVQCMGTVAAGIFATHAVLQMPQLPGWAIATAVASIAGWLLLLGCGVIGIVGANMPARGLHATSILLGFLGLGVLAVAAVIAGYGFTTLAEAEEGGRFLLVQMTRFLVMTYSLSALVAVGVVEVLSPAPAVATKYKP